MKRFESLAGINPDFVFTSGNFRQSVWSYIGRCQYHLGAFAEARYALERANLALDNDHLARTFLGLTLARRGDYANASRELQRGIEGLSRWIEDENSRDSFEFPWDPGNKVRRQISAILAEISNRQPNWQRILEDGESLGAKMEQELDRVRRDRARREE